MMRALPALQRRLIAACSLAVALLGWWIATSLLHWVDIVRFPDPATFLQSLHQIVYAQYAGANLAEHVAWSRTRAEGVPSCKRDRLHAWIDHGA